MEGKMLLILCFLAILPAEIYSSIAKDINGYLNDEPFNERLTTLENDVTDMKVKMERLLSELSKIHEAIIQKDTSKPEREKRDLPRADSNQNPLPNDDDKACIAGSLDCPYAMSSQCVVCPPGPQGTQGVTGATGIPGRDGRDGRDGVQGPRGDKGDMGTLISDTSDSDQTGTSQAAFVNKPVPSIFDVISQNNSGTTYVRWGRTVCPAGAELVYSGFIAGGHRDTKGGGSNYVCLPPVPIYSFPNAGYDSSSRIYGVEYEVDDFPQLRNQGIDDMEAVCAVCLAPLRSAVVVIPGRNECYTENSSRMWNMEYNGYLMSSSYRYQRTEYICVDATPEFRAGSHSNENDSTMYIVESRCSSSINEGLPCPPYIDGYEMTCAVCTT